MHWKKRDAIPNLRQYQELPGTQTNPPHGMGTVETLPQDIPTRYPDAGISGKKKLKNNPCQKNIRYSGYPGPLIF